VVPRTEYVAFGRPSFGDDEIAAVSRVLRSGWVGMGVETAAFEQELAAVLGVPYVVTVNSCTSALFLSLVVSGIGPGDEVICPSLTWCSTANAALYVQARPVFCDVEPDSLCVSPKQVLAKLTPRTRAVMVVHYGGLAVDVAELRASLPHGVVIVEDAAHAFGARFGDGRPVGSSGNPTCFSFYANKNLSTGEGGAIAVSDEKVAERLRSLRQHGLPVDAWKRFTHPKALLRSAPVDELGYKMNYTDLQAAIGRVQLARQREFQAIRLEVARHYVEGLKSIAVPLGLQRDCVHPDHARHLFVVTLPVRTMQLTRDDVVLALRARNVGAAIHYPPLHTMPLYTGLTPPEPLPVTEHLGEAIMTLPISGSMTVDDADYVVAQLREVLE
jgi:UDP-4-amino-4-deoxy-L-arabinose-oxoglutarate aminotransferase